MKLKYLGHAAFLIEDLLIDPFIKGNPLCPVRVEDIKCEIICVTHDHEDHIGDAFTIARQNNATLVAIHEIAMEASKQGIKSEGMNIGGEISIGAWRIKMVPAFHSCSRGNPAGFVLKNMEHEKTVYHAGDTALFSDMKLIGNDDIDVALLPIGGRYTMGIEDAVKAVELLNPHVVIPMHYNTFPAIRVNAEEFKKKCASKVVVLKPGEELEI